MLETPSDQMILDVGPKTVAHYAKVIGDCKTLLWNGPLGAFEVPPFGEGTFALARWAAELTKAGKLVSVAGGGDTVAALNAAGVTERFTYVSTAGGAFLEWLEGRTLPGIAALARGRALGGHSAKVVAIGKICSVCWRAIDSNGATSHLCRPRTREN